MTRDPETRLDIPAAKVERYPLPKPTRKPTPTVNRRTTIRLDVLTMFFIFAETVLIGLFLNIP